MQPAPYQQPVQQQVMYQQAVVSNPVVMVPMATNQIVFQSTRPAGYLTFADIYMACKAPRYESCQACAGCYNVVAPGAGLFCCTCSSCCECYGSQKPDRQEVCMAGCLQSVSSPICLGYFSACLVGFRMMGCCL